MRKPPFAILLLSAALVSWVGCSSSDENSSGSESAGENADTLAGAEAEPGANSATDPIQDPTAEPAGSSEDEATPCGICDDQQQCTTDLCIDGECQHKVVKDLACDDGDICTAGETCQADGKCLGGEITYTECEDLDVCTDPICDPGIGCVHIAAAEDAPCSNGNPCTTNDICKGGECVAGDLVCVDDAFPCTVVECEPSSGECLTTNSADGLLCTDNDPCTLGDTCQEGQCITLDGQACDDEDPCTFDTCEEDGACIYIPLTGQACVDGNPCSSGGLCVDGVCQGEENNCDDSLACTVDSCDADGECVHTPSPQACDDANPCTANTCDAALGCVSSPIDGDCSDGNPCTLDDTCIDGVCQGATLECDDQEPCTTDSCTPAGECLHVPTSLGACKDDYVVEEVLWLNDGNNLISLPSLPADQSLITVLGEIEPYTIRVMGEARTSVKLDDGSWVGNMHTIERTGAFWITLDLPEGIDEPVALTLTGTPTDPDVLYPIHAGLNWLAYPAPFEQALTDALPDSSEELVQQVIGQGIAAFKDGDGWIGNLTKLVPGGGYQVEFSEAVPGFSFHCPGCDGLTGYSYGCRDPHADNYDPDADIPDDTCVYPVPAEWSMPLHKDYAFFLIEGLHIDGAPLEPGDAVGAFSQTGDSHGFGFADGDFVTLPVVGMAGGSIVEFVLYDASTGAQLPIESSEPVTLNAGFTVFAGCTDSNAANHSPSATLALDICQ